MGQTGYFHRAEKAHRTIQAKDSNALLLLTFVRHVRPTDVRINIDARNPQNPDDVNGRQGGTQ